MTIRTLSAPHPFVPRRTLALLPLKPWLIGGYKYTLTREPPRAAETQPGGQDAVLRRLEMTASKRSGLKTPLCLQESVRGRDEGNVNCDSRW
jgi:hypothetical protein